ncbi:SAM and SH3 domain-containing protein 3 isoform X2 [Denticeps clupeoides]|uniref:SAM and SH3 domain-containing protein 3 isoform X2 n=1 Tax=Denticeps clupeoides TaxID=299321 RepID=UPI0010A2D53F|nr:SAM and SH3 domain-containing protein 3 isoform X2 [Denticeps clupeoides]
MLRRKPSNASEKEPTQVQKKKLTLQRSSSFKDFMKPKPPSPAVADSDFNIDETLLEASAHEEAGKGSGKSGKWRKIITRTMTRKTSKMVQKALAEEGAESGEDGCISPLSSDCTPDQIPGNRSSVCSNGSEETMHSPVHRQLSGCGDRQSLDSGYSQRDSMRLDDNCGTVYTGPFCGRAQVHTDFTPSPYDFESLKLQKGDIIQIIEKPPVGTWTGKLNNKVGSFKFIYVTILPEESTPPRRKRFSSQARRNKHKAKTLEEVLERIGLTELGSLLFMNGFQTLEDFGSLKESHLKELNITEPEQRTKILTAVELLHEYGESDVEGENTAGKNDIPRDSGCFESTEILENGRNEPESEPESKPELEAEKPQKEGDLSNTQEQLQELTLEVAS